MEYGYRKGEIRIGEIKDMHKAIYIIRRLKVKEKGKRAKLNSANSSIECVHESLPMTRHPRPQTCSSQRNVMRKKVHTQNIRIVQRNELLLTLKIIFRSKNANALISLRENSTCTDSLPWLQLFS